MTRLELTHYVPLFIGGELACENRLRVSLERGDITRRWRVCQATLYSATGQAAATMGPTELSYAFGLSTLDDIERKAEALSDVLV